MTSEKMDADRGATKSPKNLRHARGAEHARCERRQYQKGQRTRGQKGRSKKAAEVRRVVDMLATEIMTANGDTNNWFEFQKSKHGAAARVDEVRESPTIEGYRNKCEFAIGLNPENRRLTVGFKLDPR